jgi:hypothetical protein
LRKIQRKFPLFSPFFKNLNFRLRPKASGEEFPVFACGRWLRLKFREFSSFRLRPSAYGENLKIPEILASANGRRRKLEILRRRPSAGGEN